MRNKKARAAFYILKAAILIFIVVGIPAIIWVKYRSVVTDFESFSKLVGYLREYKSKAFLIYILAQIMQIVVSFLPGQVFQFAAGYIFGFLPGLIYSILGAALGTTITYYLARLLGSDFVKLVTGEKNYEHFSKELNSKKAYLIAFLIYLIPGTPKDMVCYLAGISDMKFKPFLVTSLVGRTPAMCGSLIFGSMYLKKNYTGMAIVGTCALVIFLICVIKRKKINAYIDHFYDEYTDAPERDSGNSDGSDNSDNIEAN
ncbi:MAG: TVP38/TMEM64 family protein [Eubacteriales bacterium]|nr:TVP38/TMEM64 family protein [Eubacteriales bacterium]